MDEEHTGRRRRNFRWPKEARQLVRIHLNAPRAQPHGQDSGDELRVLVTKLVEVSGNPRDACWRFLRQSGIVTKRAYRSVARTSAAEAIGSDCCPTLARSCHCDAAFARLHPIHAVPAGRQRQDGPGLVHQIHACRGTAYSRRGGSAMDIARAG